MVLAMTTFSAINMTPISSLFPTNTSSSSASGTDTDPITGIEATAEDVASSDQYINQMLVDDAPTYSTSSAASSLFSILV